MQQRSVSVVIPVYNVERYLSECLDSVRDQVFDGDIEVICIDDGSTDGSRGILLRYQSEKTFPRFTIISQTNQGIGAARNRGLDIAQGTYVYFLDSDDFIEPNTLQLAVDRAEKLSLDVVIWDIWYYNDRVKRDQHPPVGTLDFPAFVAYEDQDSKSFCAKDNPDAVFTSFQNWACNKMFRRSFLEEHGMRFPSLFRTEDLQFSGKAFVLAKRMGVIYERLYHYRIRTGTSSLDTKDKFPFDFMSAFVNLRKELIELGEYETYKISFARWALSGMTYNLNTLKGPDTFLKVFERLSNGGAAEMGVLDIEHSEHSNELELKGLDLLLSNDPTSYMLYWMKTYMGFIDDDKESFDLLEANYQSAQYEVSDLREKLKKTDEELRRVAEDRDRLNEELGAIRVSAEYRFGKKALRVPRAIKNRINR